MNIVMESAREYGIPLPSTALNTQLFNALVEMGFGELDNSAVIQIFEKLANIDLKTSD